MGYEKNRQIEEWDQGWRYSDSTVCFRCLSDPYLRDFVKSTASENECSFCDRTGRSAPIAIPFNALMEVIASAIFQYYGHAEDEGMGWDSEDHDYFGTTYDTRDLLCGLVGEPSDNESVVDEIIDCLGDQTWCDRSPYSLTGLDQYAVSWERFCTTVKHEVRYFFNSVTEPDAQSEVIPVPELLDELRDIIDNSNIVGTLPIDTQLFRVRPHNRTEVCDGWRALGSPPPEVSVSNRMSAAGISVFYAAMDMATARAETTSSLLSADHRVLTGAVWRNTRALRVLDLTRLPKIPSFYAEVRYERDHLLFLQDFVKNITEPVVHDGREHTEYVPPQIVTEYFRHRYRTNDGSKLDAIIYPSARRRKGSSIVVFASQFDLNPRPYEWEERMPILAIDPRSIRRVNRLRTKT